MKWFDDIFTRTKVLLISGIVGILLLAFLLVTCFFTASYLQIVPYLMLAILSAFLLICYKKGETSCQKALCGAILAVIVFFYWFSIVLVYSNGGGFDGLYGVLYTCIAVCSAVVFFNHIYLQSEHKGDTSIIKFNQIILVILILLTFADLVFVIIYNQMYYDYVHAVAMTAIMLMITCIESRIQKYKAVRSAAIADGTWTEEKRQKYKKIFKI